MARIRRFSPSSSPFANSTANRMKVPSKKPPATPNVQLLTSAVFGCSPAAAAVGAGRVALEAVWPAENGIPRPRTDNSEMINRNDAHLNMGMGYLQGSGRSHRRNDAAHGARRPHSDRRVSLQALAE